MKLVRLTGATLAVAAIIGVVTANAALASAPEYKAAKFPVAIRGTSGLGIGTDSTGQRWHCLSDHYRDSVVLGPHRISGGEIVGLNCVAIGAAGVQCTVKSTGANSGEIVTKTLDGELGLVAKAEATSGVGLLLLPETTKVWDDLEAPCLEPEVSAVEGQLAGEVSPIGVSSTTGKLVFIGNNGSQSIKEIGVLGTTVKPKLTGFGAVALSEETTESLEFESAVEVT